VLYFWKKWWKGPKIPKFHIFHGGQNLYFACETCFWNRDESKVYSESSWIIWPFDSGVEMCLCIFSFSGHCLHSRENKYIAQLPFLNMYILYNSWLVLRSPRVTSQWYSFPAIDITKSNCLGYYNCFPHNGSTSRSCVQFKFDQKRIWNRYLVVLLHTCSIMRKKVMITQPTGCTVKDNRRSRDPKEPIGDVY
jgi:hypothetical protein